VLNYDILRRDYDEILLASLQGRHYMVVFDECQAFKNTQTKTHDVCKRMSVAADRCVGLTATLLKNSLFDAYGVLKVIMPPLFTTKTAFYDAFCVTRLQDVPGSSGSKRRKVPVIIGYKNIDRFRSTLAPFFFGRRKSEVSSELPVLTTKVCPVELNPMEVAKYREALKGELITLSGPIQTNHLTALIRWQQIVDSLAVLDIPGVCSKEDEFLRMMEEDIEGKVIVFSRLKQVVKRLEGRLRDELGIKSVCIHGDIDGVEREQNKQKFLKMDSGIDVIFITMAGSTAMNLQSAATMVFYDSPWSFGDYVQLLGRMIRIGSRHTKVVAMHLVAQISSEVGGHKMQTIDEHVLAVLKDKQVPIEQAIGELEKGVLDLGSGDGGSRDLYQQIINQARRGV
jgi:SNF2 family DNA or RNA helicase